MMKEGTPSGAGPGLATVRVGLEEVGTPLGLRIGGCWMAFGWAIAPPLPWRRWLCCPRPPLPPAPAGPTPPWELVPVLVPLVVPGDHVVPVVAVPVAGTTAVDPPVDPPPPPPPPLSVVLAVLLRFCVVLLAVL